MAGRPKLRTLAQKIASSAGGEDAVFEDIADGKSMKEIAEAFKVSRPMLYAWIAQGKEPRKEKFDAARRMRAHSLVEDGLEILDEDLTLDDHSGEPAMRKARAAYRQWLAGRFNQEYEKDDSTKLQVNINAGELHLDALRQAGRMSAAPGPKGLLQAVEVE